MNTNKQTFTATGAWATVRYVAFFDAATGGNMFFWKELDTPETLANTNKLDFEIGQLTADFTNQS